MTTSQKKQDSRETLTERKVKKANDYLREELGIHIKIDLAGNSLRIRKTLVPRPGSGHTKPYQQTITLGLKADKKGIEQALKDVIELNNLLAQRKFAWKTWDHYLDRPCPYRVKQTELIGVQVERFKKHFLALPKARISREEAWRTQWFPYLNKLPFDQYLSDPIVLEAIEQKTEKASANRERTCTKLKKFFAFLEFETALDLVALGQGYELPLMTEDALPSDEAILAALALIDKPEWRTAYLLQAIFGLRNHEIFFLDRTKKESHEGITVLSVSDVTKTGFHPVAALYPEWFDEPEWQLQTAELPELEFKLDLNQTTLSKIGNTVTRAYKRFGIPFTPYKLRHAWARRAMLFGFSDETAAEFMGHRVDVHREHYHRLIAMKHSFRLAQSSINSPNRPKPPQR